MTPAGAQGNEVDRFINDQIDSVPHLEALLLLWNSSTWWTVIEVARRLYVKPDVAKRILKDLAAQKLIVSNIDNSEEYSCQSDSEEQMRLLSAVDATYRHEVVRISNMIHSKPSPAVREFANAFRFKKENE